MGTGILCNWLVIFTELSYQSLNPLQQVSAEGIVFLPFGNGAERMLGNRIVGSGYKGIDFNQHDKDIWLKAALEGHNFGFVYGIETMEELGIKPKILRVGKWQSVSITIFRKHWQTLPM